MVRREDWPRLGRRVEYAPVTIKDVSRLLEELDVLVLAVLPEDLNRATLEVDVGPRDADMWTTSAP